MKKTNRKAVKQILKHNDGAFGPDDGTFRPKKNIEKTRQMIQKEGLEEEYIENNDSL